MMRCDDASTEGTTQRLCRRAWWAFFVGGLASVVFGIVAIVNPTYALFFLASFYAASMLVDGAVSVFAALRHRNKDGWWLLLLLGVASIVVGALSLANPSLTMAAFVFAAAFIATVAGTALIALGYKIRQEGEREWLLYATGGLSMAFGALVFVDAANYVRTLVSLIAIWALLTGTLRIWFGVRMHAVTDRSMAQGLTT